MVKIKKLMLSAAMAASFLLAADTANTWVFDTSRHPAETVSCASASLEAPNGILYALGTTSASVAGTVDGRFWTLAVSNSRALNSLPRSIVITFH